MNISPANLIPEPLLSILIGARHRSKSDRISSLRSDDNDTCLLVMNGPSLNDSRDLLQQRKGVKSFAVNYFAQSEYFEQLRPEYYVFQDSHFWRDEVLEDFKSARDKAYAALREKTRWPLTVFLPSSCARRDWMRSQLDNPQITIRYWNSAFLRRSRGDFGYQGESSWLFKAWRKEWLSPPKDNVLIACLYLAERLGFGKIEFTGADFSFFLEMRVDQQTNRVGRQVEHFYGEEFMPIYKGNTGEVPTTMAHEMLRWHRSFRGLELLSSYLDAAGVRALNRSPASYVDCFERG